MIENGFAATSLDQVIADSSSSKGAFFHHFDSKLALAQALVERYAAADVAHLESALRQARAATANPGQRVAAFVRIFEDTADELMAAQSGCLYVSILTERQLAAAGTSGEIVSAIEAWRVGVAELLRAALPAGGAIDPEALADHLFVTFEGAFLLARSTGDANHMRHQLRTFRLLLEALLAPGAELGAAEPHATGPG